MSLNHLAFEKPIVELDEQIDELRHQDNIANTKNSSKLKKLEAQRDNLIKEVFEKLTAFQVVQLARHAERPHAYDYIDHIFTDFQELHGDRMFADDAAIVGGLARLDDIPVMVIGHEKGRTTRERIHHNFGSPRPEGYRKALRLMRLAEKFGVPIITFIDTQGAYPGIDAEERGQSEAIARNLFEMSTLKTPIVCIVTGEGGSGGALAIGVGDRVLMLEYSVYSVITPEGCASILWRSASKAPDAAESLKMTAQDALRLKLIDEIIKEPLGGAHRHPTQTYQEVKQALLKYLNPLIKQTASDLNKLVEQRYERLMYHGIGYKDGE